jgi:sec-independent protein translocase protein TatB
MFGIGPEELFLIAVIALLVLGPERMPKVMRDIGRVVGDLRKTSDELREEFMNADRAIREPFTGPTTSSAATPSAPAPAASAASMRSSPSARKRPVRSRSRRPRSLRIRFSFSLCGLLITAF